MPHPSIEHNAQDESAPKRVWLGRVVYMAAHCPGEVQQSRTIAEFDEEVRDASTFKGDIRPRT